MNYKALWLCLILSAFLGNFLMFALILNDLTVVQGLLYGFFVGFPYAVSIYLTGKMANSAS